MKKRFVIVGLGNFGANVATTLYKHGHEVIAVDISQETVDIVAQNVTRAVVGDGRDAVVLSHLGGKESDIGIVSTGDDITASVLATLALLDLGVKKVVVKVVSEDHARVMRRVGAAETVFPERDSAQNLASSLLDDSIVSYQRLGSGFGVQEMNTPPRWCGKTLVELQLRSTYQLSVVGVHDTRTDELVIPPDPTVPLRSTDTLILAGSDEALHRAVELENR